MKQRAIYWLLASLLSASPAVWALKDDTNQPIYIDSGTQSLENNTVIFSQNVVIKQGSIHITADQVKILRQEGKKEIVEAQGAPVTFQQTLDNGKVVKGKAKQVKYDLNSEFLVLTGGSELRQQDSFIQAENITYDVKKQQLKASSGGKARVKTVLMPAQLQENKPSAK